jgi:hypothetical protein
MKNLCILCKDEKIINVHNDDYTFMCVDVNIMVKFQPSKIVFCNETI